MLFIFYFGTPHATFLPLSLSLFLFFSLSTFLPLSLSPFHSTPAASAAVMCLAVSQRTFCLVFSNSNSRVVSCACVCVAAALRQAIIQSRVQFGGCTHTNTRTPFAEDTCDALALSLRTFCQTISGAQTVCAPLYQCTVEQLGEEVHTVNICT